MVEGTELIRLALFGQPVKASLSPVIHGLFAEQLGVDIEYRAIETGPSDFPHALETFQGEGGAGCNVTLPLKGDACRLATACSDQVKLAQAANTLIFESPGWFAHNTDGAGLLSDLAGNNGVAIAGQRILVLGAGGAVAGILGSLLAAKPAEVILVNRNQERARVLADRFTQLGKVGVSGWDQVPDHVPFDLVINATSLGHNGGLPPLKTSFFAPGAVCYDLNYHRASEPLQAWCVANGQAYLDGLGMLVEQAAESFSIWTGKRPDSTEVIERLRVEHT